jgi:hypothetical protein
MSDIIVIVIAVLIGGGILSIYIFFLITQQNLLKAIQPENRLMRPGQVWLQLIPFFSWVWEFIVVTRISDSIRLEFQSRQQDTILGFSDAQAVEIVTERPAYGIGIATAVLNICSIIPVIGTYAGLASLICMVVYWKKLSEFKRLIELRNA